MSETLSDEKRRSAIEKAGKAAFIGWFVGNVEAKDEAQLKQMAERIWANGRMVGGKVAGGKESWPPAAEAALEAVNYFALLDVAEAAKLLTRFPAVAIVLESECSPRLNDALAQLKAALDRLEKSGETKGRG